MDEMEYGIELNLDLGKFDQSIKKAQNSLADLEKETKRKIKVTGIDGLKELEVKVDTKKAEQELEKLNSVKERIASGDIKITGLNDMTSEEMRKLEESYERIRQENSRPVDISFMGYDKNFMEGLTEDINEAKESGEGLGNVGEKLKDTGSAAQSAGGKIAVLGTILKGTVGVLEKLPVTKIFNKIKQGTNQVSQNLKNSVKSVKRFALSLIGVQSAYRVVTKAINSYMAYDSELQESLQQTWAGLGSLLAPVLEYIVDLFRQLLAYINAVVKAFTGIDFVARANAKSLEKQAKAAQKVVAPFDEINNIAQEQKSNQIELPSVDIGSTSDFIEQIKKYISEGDYYGLGKIVGNKITDALDGIDWTKIQDKAGKVGKGIADFINGGVDGTDWTILGNTIAQGVNTAIDFVHDLVTTLNWTNLGNAVGTTISTTIANIDWAQFGETFGTMVIGIINFLSELIMTIDWQQVGTSVATAISNVDWGEVVKAIAKGIGAVIGAIVGFLAGAIKQFAIDIKDAFVKNITDEKTGEITGESILKGIGKTFIDIVTWIRDNLVAPFIEGIWIAMGLGNENGEAAKAGKDIGNAILYGMANILFPGIGSIAVQLQGLFNTLFGRDVKETAQGQGRKIGEGVVTSVEEGAKGLESVDFAGKLKSPLNGVIALFNQVAEKINKKFNINISGALKALLLALGITIPGGGAALLSISQIPKLSVGTDLVKDEGLAYLHAGEKVVPADVVKGGYSADNTETNELLRELIDTVDSKDYRPRITVDDIGRANDRYASNKVRVMGGSF